MRWSFRAQSSQRYRRPNCSPGRASISASFTGLSVAHADLARKTLRNLPGAAIGADEDQPPEHEVRGRGVRGLRSLGGCTHRCHVHGRHVPPLQAARRGLVGHGTLDDRLAAPRSRAVSSTSGSSRSSTFAGACSTTVARARPTSREPICARRRSPGRTSSAPASGKPPSWTRTSCRRYGYDLDLRENDVRGLRVWRCPTLRPCCAPSASSSFPTSGVARSSSSIRPATVVPAATPPPRSSGVRRRPCRSHRRP